MMQASSTLGMEGTVVKSISEMNLICKSVSFDKKLAAIKLLGEGNSAREATFKLALSIRTVQKKEGVLTDKRRIDAINENGLP